MPKKRVIILLVIVVVLAGAIGGTLIYLGQQSARSAAKSAVSLTADNEQANISFAD